MLNLGLKLWSVNDNYVKEAERLFNDGFYEYIELFVVPNSYNKYISFWNNLKIPFLIHAPHFRQGLNLAEIGSFQKNISMIIETQKFADKLNAKKIIFHPGVNGTIEETVQQLTKINDHRIVIENKPYIASKEQLICNGNSPEDIRFIIDNAKVGFCLDFGHAICSANAQMFDPIDYLERFFDLKPDTFHLADNHFDSTYDNHLHFGEGDYDIARILEFIPDNSLVTIETEKKNKDNLDDFINDISVLRKIRILCH